MCIRRVELYAKPCALCDPCEPYVCACGHHTGAQMQEAQPPPYSPPDEHLQQAHSSCPLANQRNPSTYAGDLRGGFCDCDSYASACDSCDYGVFFCGRQQKQALSESLPAYLHHRANLSVHHFLKHRFAFYLEYIYILQ